MGTANQTVHQVGHDAQWIRVSFVFREDIFITKQREYRIQFAHINGAVAEFVIREYIVEPAFFFYALYSQYLSGPHFPLRVAGLHK